jgi:hypothetical protein
LIWWLILQKKNIKLTYEKLHQNNRPF